MGKWYYKYRLQLYLADTGQRIKYTEEVKNHNPQVNCCQKNPYDQGERTAKLPSLNHIVSAKN